MKLQLLAYLLVVAVSVVSSVIVTEYSDDRNAALRISLEEKRIAALEKVCRQNVEDREILIDTARVDARANEAIANNPVVPLSVRMIRREQAKAQRKKIENLKRRLNKAEGSESDCRIE